MGKLERVETAQRLPGPQTHQLVIVAKLLGTRYLATLFGVVMVSHQIGGFLGAWLGGTVFEATGSYDRMFIADVVLCLLAAVLHMPIREAPRLLAGAPA